MTAMSKSAILSGMREATQRRKRADAAALSRARADSARARLDALDARVEAARVDPLAAAAERERQRAEAAAAERSEERRGGKERLGACRSRWPPYL